MKEVISISPRWSWNNLLYIVYLIFKNGGEDGKTKNYENKDRGLEKIGIDEGWGQF